MIGKRHEYDIMAAVESQHWWYKTLHSQVIQAIQKYSNVQQHLNHLQHIHGTQQISDSAPFNDSQLIIAERNNKLSILDAGCGTGGLLMT